jgi:epoxyqueuosine reductase
MNLTDDVKETARKVGADLVGIASADKLEGAPKGHRPSDLLSGSKSVVVVGVRMLEAIVDSLPSPIYQFMGYAALNNELSHIAYLTAKHIEDLGYLALPTPPTRDYDMKDITGTFSHIHAAVEAGLGERGLNGLLLTPEYGPRVRLVSVLTTAPLTPTGPSKKEICTKCLVCVKACPMKAIGEDGRVDPVRCLAQSTLYTKETEEEFRRQLESLRQIPHEIFVARSLVGRNVLPPLCGRCVKVCPIGRPRR